MRKRAGAELDASGETIGHDGPAASGGRSQEQQIASLVTQGRANAESVTQGRANAELFTQGGRTPK